MSETPSQYLHGTDPIEQQRLARLNGLLNDACLRELHLKGGERILDVGSGLGQLTRALAKAAGVRAVGVERSSEQLAASQRFAREAGEEQLVDFRQGDAGQLPLRADEWGTFDLVHTRFVLEHVRDPLQVVRQMVQATRPGGRIVLQDDPHDVMRLTPEPPGFSHLWNAYLRSYDRVGNDPLIGHRLVSLLHDAGARPVRNTWLFFGSCAGHADFGDYAENLILILLGVRQVLIDMELTRGDVFDETITQIRRWKQRRDAAIWFAIAWAEGRRP
jgi:SAM-dependent methyltransferase